MQHRGAFGVTNTLTTCTHTQTLDYGAIYKTMKKPAFIFDGRSIVNVSALKQIGYDVWNGAYALIFSCQFARCVQGIHTLT